MSKQNKIIIACITVLLIIISILLIIASMKKDEQVTYSVTFDSNGGSVVREQLVNAGEKVKRPQNPIKEGYMFVEWRYNNNKFDFNIVIEKDIILKAVWLEVSEEVEMVTVRFETDGGTAISNQIIKKDEKVTKPEDPTKDGYIFKGWYLNEIEYNFDTPVTENIEITAKWEEESSKKEEEKPKEEKTKVKKYTITFDSNGGSSIASQTVEEGKKVETPANPTRAGYEFTGWTLNGSTYDFNTIVKKNITLTANWKEVVKNNYTVTFDSNGGSSVSTQTVIEGNKVTKPEDPTKEGYMFNGWTLNGSNYNFSNTVNGNITLVASWTQKNYVIETSKVDQFSPEVRLKVYENGTQISFKSIKYLDEDETVLCNGTNTTVGVTDIEGETTFIVVLNGGTEVRATLQ